jgi:hypothetical protein
MNKKKLGGIPLQCTSAVCSVFNTSKSATDNFHAELVFSELEKFDTYEEPLEV